MSSQGALNDARAGFAVIMNHSLPNEHIHVIAKENFDRLTLLGKHPGQSIHEEIDDERHRQEQLKAKGTFTYTCADPHMSDGACLAVLGEEFGEVCRALLERGIDGEQSHDKHGKELRKELIQVAAVCVAWIQRLDAKEGA